MERKRRRESTLVALASEVQSIRDLIELHGYSDQFGTLAHAIRNETWDGTIGMVDIQQNFFAVYDELSSDLGLLDAEHVAKIVSFYAYCKSLIDQTRPDSAANTADNPAAPTNILNTEGLLIAISALADEIIKLPKKPLPVLEKWHAQPND